MHCTQSRVLLLGGSAAPVERLAIQITLIATVLCTSQWDWTVHSAVVGPVHTTTLDAPRELTDPTTTGETAEADTARARTIGRGSLGGLRSSTFAKLRH